MIKVTKKTEISSQTVDCICRVVSPIQPITAEENWASELTYAAVFQTIQECYQCCLFP